MSVCSAELSQAGAAGDQLFSPPTARAVPHRAAGQTSLSLNDFQATPWPGGGMGQLSCEST